MALTYLQRSYAGGASAGTLLASIGSGTTSFSSSSSLSGWTDITGLGFAGNIVVAVEYGTANEEKILCTFNGTTFTIVSRNYDGTNFSGTHAANSTFVLVYTAEEAAEANDVVQTMKTILTNTGSATTPANITVNGTASVGTGQTPAAIDHSHVIPSTSLSTWLGTVVVPLTNLATGNLPASVSTSNVAWTGGGTTWTSGTAPIIGPITGYNDYIILCNASIRASSAGVNMVVTVNQSASSTMSSPTAIVSNLTWGATATQSYCVTAVGAYSPGSSASFYVQPALTNATIYSVTITVMGIN